MVVLGGGGSWFFSSRAGGGSGASGSSVSFWCSKISTFCGWPSSSTMKSFLSSESMALPALSFTVTSTITRFELAENFAVAPAGCEVTAGGVCCPAAIKAARMTIQRFRILETKPQHQGHGAGSGGKRGQPKSAGASGGSEIGDLHVVQSIVGGQPQLQILARLAETPGAVERAVEAERRQAGNGVHAGVSVLAGGRRGEGSLVEVRKIPTGYASAGSLRAEAGANGGGPRGAEVAAQHGGMRRTGSRAEGGIQRPTGEEPGLPSAIPP